MIGVTHCDALVIESFKVEGFAIDIIVIIEIMKAFFSFKTYMLSIYVFLNFLVLIFCRTYKFKKKLPLYICQEENRLREFFNFFASLNLWKVTFMNFPFFYMPSYVQKFYWVGLLPGIPLWNSSQISQKYPWKPSDNPPWIPSIDSFWNSYRNVIRYIFLQKSL